MNDNTRGGFSSPTTTLRGGFSSPNDNAPRIAVAAASPRPRARVRDAAVITRAHRPRHPLRDAVVAAVPGDLPPSRGRHSLNEAGDRRQAAQS